jgi:hypothetical protein
MMRSSVTQEVIMGRMTQPNKAASVPERKPADGPQMPEDVQRIAIAAYYRAERRGFAPGNEVEDWLAAEAEINAPRSISTTQPN